MDDVLGYQGKHVAVTGAASGIGASTARVLAGLGAVVHGLDVNVPDNSPCNAFHRCDLADPASIDAAVEQLVSPLDSLFNCAGISTVAPSQQAVLVNFIGHRALTEALISRMPGGSSIGFVSSAAAVGWMTKIETLLPLLATDGFSSGRDWCENNAELIGENGYGFSKEAINVYVAMRGLQLAPDGPRVNGIMPGSVDTPMMEEFLEVMGADALDDLPRPLGRNSSPDEQAWPLIMLNSPRSSFVTGTMLMTDGGFSAGIVTGVIDPGVIPTG